jgi:hypothetical protein
MKSLLITLYILLLGGAFVPALALAQTNPLNTPFCQQGKCTYIPLEPLPGQKPIVSGQETSFSSYLGNALKVLIVVGGMISVATFVFYGITYMVSDVIDKKDLARKGMQSCLWALFILLASYLILITINPHILENNFNPKIITNTNTPATNPATGGVSGTSQGSAGATATPANDASVKQCEAGSSQAAGRCSWDQSQGCICGS